jgi:putative methylase
MGEHSQKRITRKLDLELFLSKMTPQPSPQAHLEQYPISESTASTMLYIAAYVNNDIISKTVLDLGCGAGRLALGAAYLGARKVVGVDIDKSAIETAVENSLKNGLTEKVQWIIGDISTIVDHFDTVLQNPPFGVQTRKADRAFLAKALEVGNSVYSLHNHPQTDKQLIKKLKTNNRFLQISPTPFLRKFIEQHHGIVKAVYAIPMTIPRMFEFHTKIKHDYIVDLYVITRKSNYN